MRSLSNPRVNKTFEALFALEDIRQIFRESLPVGLTDAEEQTLKARLAEVRKDLDAIESPPGGQKYTGKIGALDVRTREEEFINIHPIQAAGRLTPEARKAIISYGDGYSTCDYCRKPFRLDKITRPPIEEFHQNLARFAEHGPGPGRSGRPSGLSGRDSVAGWRRATASSSPLWRTTPSSWQSRWPEEWSKRFL